MAKTIVPLKIINSDASREIISIKRMSLSEIEKWLMAQVGSAEGFYSRRPN